MSRIIEAARQEFELNGYSDATTAAIARNAGVSEMQLFRYFGSKAQLFQTTIFEPIAEQLEKFVENYLVTTPVEPFLLALQQFMHANIEPLTSLVVLQTYGKDQAKGVAQVDSLAKYFQLGEAALRKTVLDKPNVDPALLVRISFVAILASIMFRDWIFPPKLASADEITRAINQFTLFGIGAANPTEDA